MDAMLSAEWICLVAGPIIAGLVSAAKKVAVIWKYPKITAALLSVGTAVISGMTVGDLDWESIATCTVLPFAAAVATYEVAKTATRPTGAAGVARP